MSKSVIWLTIPMQQRSKNRQACDWLSATALLPRKNRRGFEELSKSVIWLTIPMQQRSKNRHSL